MTYRGTSSGPHGEVYIYGNSTPTAIYVADTYHFIQGLLADDHTRDFTFDAGHEGVLSNTAVIDVGLGLVRFTSASTIPDAGDIVNIVGSTNYDGTYEVAISGIGTFDVVATYVAETPDPDSVYFQVPDSLIADENTSGDFRFGFSTSMFLPDSSNEVIKFELTLNEVHLDESAAERKIATQNDIGCMSSGGIVTVVPGDRLCLQVKNITAAENITLKHANFNITKL